MNHLAKIQFTKWLKHSLCNRRYSVHPELLTNSSVCCLSLPISFQTIFLLLLLPESLFTSTPFTEINITPNLPSSPHSWSQVNGIYIEIPSDHLIYGNPIPFLSLSILLLCQLLHSHHHFFKLPCPYLIFMFNESRELVILEQQELALSKYSSIF